MRCGRLAGVVALCMTDGGAMPSKEKKDEVPEELRMRQMLRS